MVDPVASTVWFLGEGGEMGARMRAHDWTTSPLGLPETWPSVLGSCTSLMLATAMPTLVLWDDELAILYNDAYAPIAGNKHPVGLGRPYASVWPEIWEAVQPLIQRTLAGEAVTMQDAPFTIDRKGSTEEAFFTFYLTPLRDDGVVRGLQCSVIETTERIAAAAHLVAVQDSMAGIWKGSPDLLVGVDDQGIFRRTNPAWKSVLGYDEADLIGHHLNEFILPEDHGDTLAKLNAASSGATATMVNRYRHKHGGARWIAWSGTRGGELNYATGRDITAEKASAAALRLFGKIVQSDKAPILAYGPDFRVIGFNQSHEEAFVRVMGRHQAIGDFLPGQFPPEQEVIVRGFMERALSGETFSVIEKFGDPQHVEPTWEITYSPLRDEDGTIFGAFHIARDISDKVQAQEELATTQEALRQSQKMEAVGQLTGGLAHDFNNLLAGISGSLELMQIRMQQGRLTDVDRYMTAAQGAAKRAAALTHRLLAFSRRQTLDPKPTDVNRLATGMHELIQRTVGPSIPVEVVGVTNGWPVLVDQSQLENALLNLCINARDAMPDGGSITIETANKWMDERAARQHDMPEGQYLSLAVTDTGTGMPPEVVERVFEPFFTTKPIGEGTGLGLSMIYGFAQQSDGQVRIYSEVGQGTTVCIYLPRHYGAVEEVAVAERTAELPRSQAGETVLIVDDEPTVRMLVTDILEDFGYASIEAGDSATGLKVLQSDVRIDLLVTDVGLPGGMNGRQMADAARTHRPHLKVLFITGYAENAILGKGTLPPGMAVLTKPFAMDTMAARIRSMIECGKEQVRRH